MDMSLVSERYWCHMCSQTVNPIMEVEIKCPFCQSGFVEELGVHSHNNNNNSNNNNPDPVTEFGSSSDRALSLWAPILLGMMGNPRSNGRRFRRIDFEDDDDDDEDDNDYRGDTESDRELESIIARRRRRSSATILQLLQGIRAGIQSESENNETDRDRDRGRNRNRERDRLVLINPFNQTIIVQGSYDGQNQNQTPIGSLGDYFIGPGLDMLLQHLAENDPNRYGTPPAQREAVEALPSVKIKETLQCSVCLDDFEIGTEAKEMPCKHKFHSQCILPWLELHSSCPVCRKQLPADESKLETERSRGSSSSNRRESERSQRQSEQNRREIEQNRRESEHSNDNNNDNTHASDEEGDAEREVVVEARNESGRRFSIPWPFSGFFSSSSSQSGGGNNSTSTSSGSQSGTASQRDEN